MNNMPWPPAVGKWYLRWDKGEIFQVTGYDETSRKAVIQTYDGAVDAMDEATWKGLSLGWADPPEDWTGPVEAVDVVHFGAAPGGPVSEEVGQPPEEPV